MCFSDVDFVTLLFCFVGSLVYELEKRCLF